MTNETRTAKQGLMSQKGLTMIEIIVVIAIMGALFAIAIPSFMQWRESLNYKTAARGISMALRDARNKAITTNLQCAVEFDVAGLRYRQRRGNLTVNSNWIDLAACPPVSGWTDLPPKVGMNANGASLIWFNPNGSASADVIFALPNQGIGQVMVTNESGASQHKVSVYAIGQIRIED